MSKMINLEELKNEIREEMGTDAAYLAADYEGSSSYICDAIQDRADGETSIYYSDIIKFISENVEAVNDAIAEFGWEGCGSDLYKAGQMAEFVKIENDYYAQEKNIIKYAAIMDLLYSRKMETISADTWEAIADELEGLDNGNRFDDITDIITRVLEEEQEYQEQPATLDRVAANMRDGFDELADAIKTPAGEEATA